MTRLHVAERFLVVTIIMLHATEYKFESYNAPESPAPKARTITNAVCVWGTGSRLDS
jgi:hypothetical protein